MLVELKSNTSTATSASIGVGIEPETCECVQGVDVSVRTLDHRALGKNIV